jgi:hypothetical protein
MMHTKVPPLGWNQTQKPKALHKRTYIANSHHKIIRVVAIPLSWKTRSMEKKASVVDNSAVPDSTSATSPKSKQIFLNSGCQELDCYC